MCLRGGSRCRLRLVQPSREASTTARATTRRGATELRLRLTGGRGTGWLLGRQLLVPAAVRSPSGSTSSPPQFTTATPSRTWVAWTCPTRRRAAHPGTAPAGGARFADARIWTRVSRRSPDVTGGVDGPTSLFFGMSAWGGADPSIRPFPVRAGHVLLPEPTHEGVPPTARGRIIFGHVRQELRAHIREARARLGSVWSVPARAASPSPGTTGPRPGSGARGAPTFICSSARASRGCRANE